MKVVKKVSKVLNGEIAGAAGLFYYIGAPAVVV
jgi:hypothetical protein